MSRHRSRVLVSLIVPAAMLIACGGSGGGKSAASPKATVRTTDLDMGGTLTTALRNTVTIHSFESPAKASQKPPEGETFAAADVETCAGPNPDRNTGIGPQHFLLATKTRDGYQAQATGVRAPALNLTFLAPNGCTRGWVSFKIPLDQEPTFVYLVSSEIGRWRIP